MGLENKSRAANPAMTQDDDIKLQRDYTTETGLKARFSMFKNCLATTPAGETTLEQLAADIQGGKWRPLVERLRGMTAEEYSQNKRNLPAVAFGGTFTRRRKDALVKPSGLVVLDIDHIDPAELAEKEAQLKTDPHTAICFVSPSGKGLKAVFPADFTDDATFKQAYRAIANYLKEKHSLTLDESGKDVCRLCFVSYDPTTYFNPGAVQFRYEAAAREPEQEQAEQEKPQKEQPTRPAKSENLTKQEKAFVENFLPAYHKQFIESLVEREILNIASAERGTGNVSLNNAALKLAHYYHAGHFDKAHVKSLFCKAYIGRPGSAKTDSESSATFESGFTAGLVEPGNIPDPAYVYGGGIFKLTRVGVFHIGFDKEGNETAPVWLSSPVCVKALTRNAKGREWGRLLEWPDKDGVLHEWAMPMELLQGDGNEVRGYLAAGGVDVSTNGRARNLFNSYLQLWPVQARARCTQKLGWHNDVYVLPDQIIGDDEERVVFQNTSPIEPAFEVSGSIEDWRNNVAAMAAGNSRVVFAISAALAAPLAELINAEGGGFHFRGGSSTGKSTALIVACSVWGGSSFRRAWRTTSNGLEGLAALHNDGLLVLDELSEIDPKEAGAAAYMLANGEGKTRSTRSGVAKKNVRFRVITLSAGEESLSALMAKADRKANAGQELRLADIDADAGAGMGMFQNLNGFGKPGALALALKIAAEKWHGAAGVEFLRQVAKHKNETAETLTDGIKQFVEEINLPEKAAQAGRVARRFGLVAVAGEIATACGLTGWQEGEAERAAKECFSSWLAGYGAHESREDIKVLQQVKAFFEAHGNSRFEKIAFEQVGTSDNPRIINRVGFWRQKAESKEYLVFPEAFKSEICKGLDHKAALKVLEKHGWFERGQNKPAQQFHIPGTGKPWLYVFNSKMLAAEI